MQRIAALILALTVGCVHAIPLGPVEQCAQQGMALQGVTLSSGVSTGFAAGNNGGYLYSRGAAYGQAVSCQMPTSAQQQCIIAAARRSGFMKADYEPFGRNVLIGLGYVLFIIPGIALSIVFEVGRDDYEDEALAAYNSELQRCVQPAADTRRPPGWSN